MKSLISFIYLIICFNYINLKVEEEEIYFELKITNLLTNDIPIKGLLLLQTEGYVVVKEEKIQFSLSITKEEDKSQYPINCKFNLKGAVFNDIFGNIL